MYIPSMVIAYDSALHSAATHLNPRHIIECMDLSTVIAANDDISTAFRQTDRMKELVTVFALNSREMVRLHEIVRTEKKPKVGRKKEKEGKSLGLWEIGGTGVRESYE